ncbi:terminase TerL endonuclease subunit [Mammaliicoccus sciuri]|uniref:terminase large subunit n=1 Tax=Mammaliicoccus sciuri TaxID=1296 RepID=UPI002B25669E|nr:terminase TerL endonuclease subunit [Mammaliicoccus sciuri]WQJ66654.1 terminase TerL endonuclease subunit [Mammaliicoccus sciuri]WQK64301.1 terminase TerL endonuclease subunit [Mammaliicoccus sciuri]
MSSLTDNKLIDPVTFYAKKVLRGDILASNMVKRACKRHLKDLKREDLAFQWQPNKALHVINFIEKLPDIKTGECHPLALFQKFIVGSIYGWQNEQGHRRFKRAYISMARKNGKSIIVAGINLYELLFGENPKLGRQIYCTANAKDQAKVVWEMCMKQLNSLRDKSAKVYNITKITESKNLLANKRDGSILKPLSKDTKKLDGFDPYIGILDEYHEAKDDSMFEVLRSGMIQQVNRLIAIISTAGFNLNGPMYKEYVYCKGLMYGKFENDNYFVYCAEMDNDEEIDNEKNWIKANPLLEVESFYDVALQTIKDDMQEQIDKGETHKIKTKNFNIWQSNSESSLVNIKDWEKISVEQIPDIKNRDVYIGVDLSRLNDLTGIGFIYPIDKKYYIDSHVFVGTRGGIEAKIKRDKIDYLEMVNRGNATLTRSEYGVIDFEHVIEFLINYVDEHNLNVIGLCYDPWHSETFLTSLEKRKDINWRLIEVGQSFKVMSQPIKDFQLDVIQEKIIHASNPALDVGVNNAVLIYDKEGNCKVDKSMYREKIDSIVSVLIAWTEARMHEFQENWDEIYESEEFGF